MAIRTMWAEARGEAEDGEAAVAHVMLNRLNSGKYGKTLKDVALAKNQFEPWGNPQTRAKMVALQQTDPEYQRLANIFDRAAKGEAPDNTGGAVNFWSPTAQAGLGRKPPKWASTMEKRANIGRHEFYADKGSAGGRGTYEMQSGPATGIATNDVADRSSLASQVDALPYEQRADLTTQAIEQVSAGRAVDIGAQLKKAGIEPNKRVSASTLEAMREGMAVKRELGFKPVDLLEAVRRNGGLDPTGLTNLEKANVVSAGKKLSEYGGEYQDIWNGNRNLKKAIYRRNGLPPDELALRLEETGYILQGSGPEGLRMALSKAARGEKIYGHMAPEHKARLDEFVQNKAEAKYNESLPPEDYYNQQMSEPELPSTIDEVIAQLPDGDYKSATMQMSRMGHNFTDDEMQDIFNEIAAARNEDIMSLPDSLDGDLTARQSDLDFIDSLANGDRDFDAMLAEDMDRLRGLGDLTEAETASLAEADQAMRQVSNVEAAIKVSAGCILKG
jgi:hypothetical protein